MREIMVTQLVTTSVTLDAETELAIVPIGALMGPITITMTDEPTTGQQVWVKCVGNAGDINVTVAAATLEADTGLETLNSAGASRLLYYDGVGWLFLTYM